MADDTTAADMTLRHYSDFQPSGITGDTAAAMEFVDQDS